MDEGKVKNAEQLTAQPLSDLPPIPLTEQQAAGGRLMTNAALLTAAGAGAFLLVAATMTPTVGATRSTKIKWQERQLEIEKAECDAASAVSISD